MTQFGQSQFYALADFTHNVIDSALADSVTTVPIYTAMTSTLISVAQTQLDTSTTMTATTLERIPTSPAETIIVMTEDITQTTTSTDSSNHAPVDISDIPVTVLDTSNVPTASAQTPHTSTTVNANPFDLQTSLSKTRSTTTEVVYTQGKIQFTFTTPTSTFAPHLDITKIMQMADLYERQNQIQKSMFENIALNRLVENDHTMWNAITYVKGKMQHAQQIMRPQYVPLHQPRLVRPYYPQYRVPFTHITRQDLPSPPPPTTPSEVLSVPSQFSSRSETPDNLSTYIPPSPVTTQVVQLKRIKMTNSEINIQQIDQTPSKKKFVTKPIPTSKLTFKHKAAFTASTAVTSGEQTAHIYEAESSPSSSLGSCDDPLHIPGQEHKVKQKYEKYQKIEPKSGKKSF